MLWPRRDLGKGLSKIVQMQRGRVRREKQRLRRKRMDNSRCVDASTFLATHAHRHNGHIYIHAYPFSSGIAILFSTTPVSALATLTRPSVPAEKSDSPSTPNPRQRQLPLWRRVLHTVSMWPVPLRAADSDAVSDGRRKVCTWPVARPTATIGSLGCTACANSSAESGREQTVSNMAACSYLAETDMLVGFDFCWQWMSLFLLLLLFACLPVCLSACLSGRSVLTCFVITARTERKKFCNYGQHVRSFERTLGTENGKYQRIFTV